MTVTGFAFLSFGFLLMFMAVVPGVAKKARGGIFYGWYLVAISGFVMVIATVPIFHAMSVWAVALERHFGWTRTELGLALTLTRVEGGIMGPAEGYLADRVGTRTMVLIGLTITGIGFVLFGMTQNLWMFYMAYLVMSLGQGLGSWMPMMTLLNHWFTRQRSVAVAWSNMGSRAGALLLVPAIAWAVSPGHNRLGWEMTAMLLGVFTIAVAVPISRLIRNRPQEYGLLPDGDPPPASRGQSASEQNTPQRAASARRADTTDVDFTAAQALRTSSFWLISFGHGFTSMIILAIMSHLGLLMQDKGFTLQTTAWLVAAYTGVAMGAQLLGGYSGDLIPKRIALFIFTSIQATAVVVLTFANSLPVFYMFAVLFGIGFGGRNPLTIAVRGEYFGRASFGKILGISSVPMNILLLMSSPFAGYLRDVQGDYTDAFLILAGLNYLGGFLFLMARKPQLSRPATAPQPQTLAASRG